jgi:thiol-disulfide isomerase/thioredoxin
VISVCEPNCTPIRWSANRLLQRRQIIFGMAAAIAAIASGANAGEHESEIPTFRSGRFQFTILRPQQILPSIRLFQLNGGSIDLISLRGRPTLVNFWATWCPACRLELPILDRLRQEHRHTGLEVLAVSEDRSDREAVERFVRSLKIQNLPIYLDPHGYVAFDDTENSQKAPFGLYGMPITYAIAASGSIVGYMPGAADWASAAAGNLIEYLRRS